MIQIWRWDLPLPPFLQFLSGPIGSAIGTLAFWLLVALILQFVVLRIAKAFARRTATDIEDVILDVSRRPLILIILLFGVMASLESLGFSAAWVESVDHWVVSGIIAVATYWLWRILKEVVIHYGERIARMSETRVDDVLLPIVDQFAPILLFILGGALILEQLGVRLDALLVAIGGAAFILAFALQDILSNVFSGLSLLVDTPFRYGDLVQLEDGKICQVVKIGVRVTQLYDTDAHAVIYMPNSKLANERLTNLMQPTPELISTVRLELNRDHDVERVRQVLNEVLDGHPDLLGELGGKLRRLADCSVLSEEKRAHSRRRLEAERAADQSLVEVMEGLQSFADAITRSEGRGFSKQELGDLMAQYGALARTIGQVRDVDRRLEEHRGEPETFLDRVVVEVGAESLVGRMWHWANVWSEDPDLLRGEDDARLRAHWSAKILSLLRRCDDLRRRLERPDSLEQRLDDAVRRLRSWLAKEFKQPTPPWKWSGAGFKGFADGAAIYSLFFFVDNIELEHFNRQGRVEGQVRREVARRLRQEGIEFANRRYEIAFLQGANGGSPPAGMMGQPSA